MNVHSRASVTIVGGRVVWADGGVQPVQLVSGELYLFCKMRTGELFRIFWSIYADPTVLQIE